MNTHPVRTFPVELVQDINESRAFRSVKPLGRHRMGANLDAYTVRRRERRLRRLELAAAIKEAERELQSAAQRSHALP